MADLTDKPVASKPSNPASNAELLARLEALEAKNHKLEEEAEEVNPPYAPVKDSAEKSRYPEASEVVYKGLGLAGSDGNYSDLDKVQAFYDSSDDAEKGVKVTSYRVRAINDDVVVSYTYGDGADKGVYYPHKK